MSILVITLIQSTINNTRISYLQHNTLKIFKHEHETVQIYQKRYPKRAKIPQKFKRTAFPARTGVPSNDNAVNSAAIPTAQSAEASLSNIRIPRRIFIRFLELRRTNTTRRVALFNSENIPGHVRPPEPVPGCPEYR